MTTPNTRFAFACFDASGKTIGTASLAQAPVSSRQPAEIVTFFASVPSGPARCETDFDALVSEMEASPADAQALADGRRWVGQQFYAQGMTLAGLRLAAGLSQRQLAEACGIEQPHVSRYESGRHEPSLTLAARMAGALGVGLDTLFAAWSSTHQQAKASAHVN